MYNDRLASLFPYPFERVRELTADIVPPANVRHISLGLGEPKHAAPDFVLEELADRAAVTERIGLYPATKGSDDLREAVAQWLQARFGAVIDPDTEVLPVNGTREALFSFAQAILAPGANVLMPNPFYQIYEGAALLAGANPVYIANSPAAEYRQDFDSIDANVWRETQLVYVCTPGNPTGTTLTSRELQHLIELAHEHDFVIASDECYSEIYFDDAEPPVSLLRASNDLGNDGYARCIVFHSLSKRSNLPGLRSGFVAGDRNILQSYLLYRTYHGCAMGAHIQAVSALAWRDEEHVTANRELYRRKFEAVTDILRPCFDLYQPDGGFYHWLRTPMPDRDFCRKLLETENVTAMPGSFVARDDAQGNPGEGHMRVAWVAELDDCITAAKRLANCAQHVE